MSDTRHACDDTCVCPVHGTPLIYAPAWDDHACQDITCEYGHGGVGAGIWHGALQAMAEARAAVQAREDRRREVFERHYRAWHPAITQVMQLACEMSEEGSQP